MGTMQHDYIQGRDDFFKLLDVLLSDAKALQKSDPTFVLYAAFVKQLEAMKTWTANGRIPTKDERKSIAMGVQIAREMEVVSDRKVAEFCKQASELVFYFKHWKWDADWLALDDSEPDSYLPDDSAP